MEKTFMEAMDFRHACKIFDETKKIDDETINYILEAGRKSPSSFGMEHWKFLVITNKELKEKIRTVCWDQVQVTSCSHLMIILARIEDVKANSSEVVRKFNRRGLPQDAVDAYIKRYADFKKNVFVSDEKTYAWSARQTYIALGNMMTAGAIKGVDSCPIEGFEKDKLEEILKLDKTKYQVAVVLPFGYRINEQSKQLREELKDIVEFIN